MGCSAPRPRMAPFPNTRPAPGSLTLTSSLLGVRPVPDSLTPTLLLLTWHSALPQLHTQCALVLLPFSLAPHSTILVLLIFSHTPSYLIACLVALICPEKVLGIQLQRIWMPATWLPGCKSSSRAWLPEYESEIHFSKARLPRCNVLLVSRYGISKKN